MQRSAAPPPTPTVPDIASNPLLQQQEAKAIETATTLTTRSPPPTK